MLRFARARSYLLCSEGPYPTLLALLGRALSYPTCFARKGPTIPHSLRSEGPYPTLRNVSHRHLHYYYMDSVLDLFVLEVRREHTDMRSKIGIRQSLVRPTDLKTR